MEQLTKSKEELQKAWSNADNNGKKLLENLYGKEVFESKGFHRIKTFDDALKETGKTMPDFSCLPEDIRDRYEAIHKMEIIAEALNEGWFPDWDDEDEYKWRPWFYMSPSAFRFYYSCYDHSFAFAGSGSRLHFKSEEISDYAAKQFLDIWKKIQIG